MVKEEEVLRKLLAVASWDGARNWITTDQLDATLLEIWGNDYDARMHCNSMLRRGVIDYWCDGDWEICVTEEELNPAPKGGIG